MQATKILLADNDQHFRESVREFLEMQGFQVITAGDPLSAKRMIEQETPALAVLDLRLTDDTDENDRSGLDVAKETNPAIPKIICTGFPGFASVREALMATPFEGVPPAVGFVAKQEGLQKLLEVIRLALWQPNQVFESRLLAAFNATSLVALNERGSEIGAEASLRLFQESAEGAVRDLTELRDRESQRGSQLHWFRLTTAGVGTALVLVGAAAFYADLGKLGVLTMVCGLICTLVGSATFKREDAAHKRLKDWSGQLAETERYQHLLAAETRHPQATNNESETALNGVRPATKRELVKPAVQSNFPVRLIEQAIREVKADLKAESSHSS